MAWLWGDTFDHFNDLLLKYPHAWLSFTGTGRFGSKALTIGTGGGGVRQLVTPGGSHAGGNICIVLMWVMFDTATTVETGICSIAPSMANHNHVAFTLLPNGSISAFAGFTGTQNPLSATGGFRVTTSDPGVIQPLVWHLLEFKVLIDATMGTITARLDGRTLFSLQEQPTVNPDSGGSNWSVVAIGGEGGNPPTSFDMFILCDGVGPIHNDFLGIRRAECKRVTAAGGVQQWSPFVFGNPSGTNVTCVDDVIADQDDTTVVADTVGLKDIYKHGALTDILAVRCVQVVTIAKNPGTTPRALVHTVRVASGGTDYDEPTPRILPAAYAAQVSRWPVHPQSKTTWTVANVNAMEFGQKVTA